MRKLLLSQTGKAGGVTVSEVVGNSAQAGFAPIINSFNSWEAFDEWLVRIGMSAPTRKAAREQFVQSGGAQIVVEE